MNADMDFGQLVEQHHDSLYRFAFSLTGSESDACDLVQQTFYIWARKGNQVRETAKIKSWLFTTLHREFLQMRRRSQRFPHVEYEAVETELPALAPHDLARLDGERVIRMMQQLDDPFRAALALFYLEDQSYEEIAGTLDLPVGTVKSRLSRGVAQLRRLLARDLATDGKGMP
jgi:RNA polymerase sigma-70 factor (ECF subfamily)